MDQEKLDALCSSFPGTTRDVKWGNDLCYCIGGKMYAVTGLEGSFGVSFRLSPDQFVYYTEREGIRPAPYLARYHWVLVEQENALTESEWKSKLLDSYQMTLDKLSKKIRDQL